ncbi:MAG: hypothetical protein HY287_06205 [Planctomycetes bacterium]|nr:hypothetical protein [Planctomycetota bacterium]MBI3833906.1 hypothetical protein [Planctomycetota bacterium]
MRQSQRSAIAAALILFFVGATGANAAIMKIHPVSASGTNTIVGDEIKLTGGNQRVFLNVQLSGWGPSFLKSWQVKLDSNSWSSGLGAALTPAAQGCAKVCIGGSNNGNACTNAANCPGSGLCSSKICEGGTNNNTPCNSNSQCTGGGTCIETCTFKYEAGSSCPAGTGQVCDPGFINTTRNDWVHINEESSQGGSGVIVAVDLSTLGWRFGAVVVPPGSTFDDGTVKYGATIVVDVPSNAIGTYTFSLVPGGDFSFMTDDNNVNITPIVLQAAKITVLCSTAAQCNDNNACTADTCNQQGACVNTPNYNTATQCCNPANGSTTNLSDGNQCTQDLCDTTTGVVSHPNSSSGTACGSQTSSQCNLPDTCDGNGLCKSNLLTAGTPCGDPTNTDCNGADTCDGNGTCLGNLRSTGTPCGNFSSGPCDNPDTCNGAGACLSNNIANNTPCDDSLFCTVNEKCTNAICGGGTPRNCDDLLTCTADSCNESQHKCDHTLISGRCLIAGVCYSDGDLNPANQCEACNSASNATNWTIRPDGSICNDGNACTGTGRPGIGVDTCTNDVCAGVPDPDCNSNCPFAVDVVVGSNVSNNNSGGPDDGEASCQPDSNNDVWFKFTPICTGVVFVSTTGSNLQPVNDTVLSIYTKCPADGGVEIACDDDSGVGLQSALFFNATAGQTYIIRVAGFMNNKGNILLNIRPVSDCLIDGFCYAEDDLNPANDCQACIPDISTTSWSPRMEGSQCGNNASGECDNPDACDGAGVCESNHKTDNIPCSDEVPPNVCTKNFCSSGSCIHPPEPVGLACGDPKSTECDRPDSCDGAGSCASNLEGPGHQCGDQSSSQCDKPDTCNGQGVCLINHRINGLACDDGNVCTGGDACSNGVCVGTPIPQPPIVAALSPRYISATPQLQGSVAPVALLVTSPDYPCLHKYIDGTGHFVASPVSMLPSAWGTVVCQDPDIVPNTTYNVQAECGAFLTSPGTAKTYLWGDVNQDGVVDIRDVAAVVDMFREIPSALPIIQGDLFPCTPDHRINIIDIATVVDAFRIGTYPCGLPCH